MIRRQSRQVCIPRQSLGTRKSVNYFSANMKDALFLNHDYTEENEKDELKVFLFILSSSVAT